MKTKYELLVYNKNSMQKKKIYTSSEFIGQLNSIKSIRFFRDSMIRFKKKFH